MRLVVFVATAIVLAVAIDRPAAAGHCLKDQREIKLDKDNILRLRDYRCRLDRDPSAALRVQFQRLSEKAAGVLLLGGEAPWFNQLYGTRKIFDNEVLTEYKTLVQRFGTATRDKDEGGGESTKVNLSVAAPEQEKEKEGEGTSVSVKRGSIVKSFSLPAMPEIPLVDELLHILNEQTWPASLQFEYISASLEGITMWRYLNADDLRQYGARLKRYNALVQDRRYGTRKEDPKAVKFLAYLTANGWPEKFLYVSGKGCGDGIDFSTNHYDFEVEVAIIENASSQPVMIEQLLGRRGGSNQLRLLSASSPGQEGGAVLESKSITLEPAQKVVVPLALTFKSQRLTHSDAMARAEEAKTSQEHYEEILALRPGTILQAEMYTPLRGAKKGKQPNTFVIRKVRESFKPPTLPEDSNYAFGPEWSLGGFIIGGERTMLEGRVDNFIQLTAGAEVGSCPILYAWEDSESRWVRHGKVIHKAQSRAEEMSETIEFDGFVGRVKLAEEELERAQLNAVRLTVELEDGTSRELAPDVAVLAARDSDYAGLYAGDDIEVHFTLPDGVVPSQVVRSKLTVTGFYERYSRLLAARGVQPRRLTPLNAGE